MTLVRSRSPHVRHAATCAYSSCVVGKRLSNAVAFVVPQIPERLVPPVCFYGFTRRFFIARLVQRLEVGQESVIVGSVTVPGRPSARDIALRHVATEPYSSSRITSVIEVITSRITAPAVSDQLA